MDSKGKFGLNYTEDFRVACAINGLKHSNVLQYFVNKVSFYAFNGGEMEPLILWATDIVIDCKEDADIQVAAEKDGRVRRTALKYILLLNDLSEDMRISDTDKVKESEGVIKEWAEELLPHDDYPEAFQLENSELVNLTFDFCLVCRMNGLSVQQVLQYYMDHISLPREKAVNIFEMVDTHPCMAFFGTMMFSQSEKIKRIPIQQEIQKVYSERILSLDEVLREEEDVEKRMSVYRSFYAEWYNALRKSIN